MVHRQVSRLGLVVVSSIASALVAFLFYPRMTMHLQATSERYFRGMHIPPGQAEFFSYAVIFTFSFLSISFIAHHLSISRKAKGIEKVDGFLPVLGRWMIVAGAFCVGILFLMDHRYQPPALSAIVNAARTPASITDTGYKNEDRQKLDKLIHEGTKHD